MAIDQLKLSMQGMGYHHHHHHHPIHTFRKTCFREPALPTINNLIIVIPETSLQVRTSLFIASSTGMEAICFQLSIALMVFLMWLQYLHFSDQVTPWYILCKYGVVLSRRKKNVIDLRFSIFGWAVQSSIMVFFDFPITNRGIFSPHVLAAANPNNRILTFLTLLQFSHFKYNFLSEVLYKIEQNHLYCI